MNQYIRREEILNSEICKDIKCQDCPFAKGPECRLHKYIFNTPAVDVVEVVRCKDCQHNHTKTWNQGKRDKPDCRFTDLIRSNEFYCGFGEREEE